MHTSGLDPASSDQIDLFGCFGIGNHGCLDFRLHFTNMNCRGFRQIAVCCRRNYHLLTRKGSVLKFLPEGHRLKFDISTRSFTPKADSRENDHISPGDIQQALVDLNMKVEYGHTCIITQCPKVGRAAQKSRSDRLYINTTSGHFVCEHCNNQGAWPVLEDNLMLLKAQKKKSGFTCFKDVESVRPLLHDVCSGRELLSSCVPFGSLQDEDADRLKETFGLQLLETKTLDRFGVRCDLQHNYVVFPVIVNDCVQSVKKITCHSQGDEVIGTLRETFIPRSGVTGVFGLDLVAPSVTKVVLTSSEVDAMAVVQETKTAAIALPRGTSSLPQEVLPSLERFETIILWFGDDIRAWESAIMFSKKLNNKRCHIIRPSMDDPGPLTALMQGLKLSTILSKAQPVSHDSIVTFTQLKQEVLSEYLHAEQVAGVKWKRFPILNKLLKGHRRGELTVFTGPTGSGKTTFISEYSLDLCMQGVSTLWGSFEISNVRLAKIMLTQFAQQCPAKNIQQFETYSALFESLPMYFMTFHGQESIKKVVNAMKHAVYIHDIVHVVLDNLQFMMGDGGMQWNDRFMKQDAIIGVFRKFATDMNCHVTLVIHPRKEKESEDLTTASVFGTAKATQEADNVLILQDKRLTSVRGKKYLQVTKNRFDGDLGLMVLKFDKESLSFAAQDKEKTTRQTDNRDAHHPDDDDDGNASRVIESNQDEAEEL